VNDEPQVPAIASVLEGPENTYGSVGRTHKDARPHSRPLATNRISFLVLGKDSPKEVPGSLLTVRRALTP